MNSIKFFVYQVLLTFLGIANDMLFTEFVYIHFDNRIIPALMETPINLVLYYFIFKLYFSLKTIRLPYKILIHLAAFILGAIFVGLTFGILEYM
ncbi:hypothetical protein [Bacillus sp. CHD6a]|uniref:hypothetical protein n=1 Tax=Bacillus sp. CHD6a TaxID=1643452 RepID=UPI0006CDFCC7|nr:hypothetical protein [Bacillus sp. CHD6a]KPB03911.1 hypothetical protein AAV98_14905 [Bacillus sp. CHD6a]